MRQYSFSEIENLLNEKRDIEQKNAALKAEIAEVEAVCIKVNSNEEIINNRVETIKFDIAKGKETYSDLEDRLAELEGKRKRVEEQQQIFQLFEKFDSNFTVLTVETVINNSTNVLTVEEEPKFNSCLEFFCHYSGLTVEEFPTDGSSLTEEQFDKCFSKWMSSRPYHVPAEASITELNDNEVMAIFNLRKQLIDTAYGNYEEAFTNTSGYHFDALNDEMNTTDELKESGTIEEIRQYLMSSDLSKDSSSASKNNTDSTEAVVNNFSHLEEFPTILNSCLIKVKGENIEEAISNAESEPFSIPTYIEEELEVMATTRQLTAKEEIEFYTRTTSTALLVKEHIKKAKSNSSSTNSSWVKDTLMGAVIAPDSIFDEDGLDYIQHIVKQVTPFDIYTKETHNFIVDKLHKESSQIRKDCATFLEFGLRYYFDTDFKEYIQIDEKTFNKVSNYLQNFSKKK